MSFDQKVLELVKQIPKCKVTTYGEIAKKLGTSPRVVGQTLKRNKRPDKISCFKVIKSNGEVGGYMFGKEEKIKRLRKCGIEVKDGKVSLDKYLYRFE